MASITRRLRDLLLGAMALAGLASCQDRTPPDRDVALPLPVTDDAEFRDTTDLLGSLEDGSFTERARVDLKAAVRAPLEPVKIRFARGSRVSEDQQAELKRLAALVAAEPDIVLEILGCSNTRGAATDNLRSSRKRALSVAKSLRELGVPESRIGEVEGRGEECAVRERVVLVTPVRGEDAS